MQIDIAGRTVGDGCEPYVIAELSANHNGSLDRAKQIVEAAAGAGVDALKLQTYTADTMTLPGAYTIQDKESLWHGRELYDLYQEANTPWEWHEPLFGLAKQRGLHGFSSPFDASSVDFLEALDVPAHKIASFENTDIPLLKKIAATGKPIIMSTGASTTEEIDQAVETISAFHDKLVLLHCTSAYPSDASGANIATIGLLKERYGCVVGLSDHSPGVGVAVAAVAAGAAVIEKHITLRRSDGGVDSAFSLEPEEFSTLKTETTRAQLAVGSPRIDLTDKEVNSRFFKRSIYVSTAIQAGEKFSEDNIRVIRPSLGIEPKYYEDILGRTAAVDIAEATPLDWEMVTK